MMLLSHAGHSHEKPQKTVTPVPTINESTSQIEETSEPSPTIIQVQSSSPIQSNVLPGLGEFMFVMIVLVPIILSSIKTRMQE